MLRLGRSNSELEKLVEALQIVRLAFEQVRRDRSLNDTCHFPVQVALEMSIKGNDLPLFAGCRVYISDIAAR